jgi:hypothetical protein
VNLSIVIAARNDDYLPRLRRSLAVLNTLCVRLQFSPEIILVEWNPSTDKAPLARSLPKFIGLPLRIITVSPELHRAQAGSDVLPFFEYTAKNAGIRRAKGNWVLTTNADDIYTEGLVAQLKEIDAFDSKSYYRVDRHDVEEGKSEGNSADEILAGCAGHVWRVVKAADGAAGDFTLLHRSGWEKICGHPELVSADTIDTYTVWFAEKAGLTETVLPGTLYHQGHPEMRTGWGSIYQGIGPSAGVTPDNIQLNGPRWGLAGVDLPEVTR